ncbi:hypothetical protein ACJJTC_016871 [Scirpophaga incertulas]
MNRDAVLAFFLGLATLASAEVTTIRSCPDVSPEICTIRELRIAPCPRHPCPLKKGRNATLDFDFTPNFAASKLQTAVYWADDPQQTPFGTVGIADACPHITCPTVAGTPNIFTYTLYIGKKLPNGKYWFRWKVWNEDNPAEVCCLETRVELRR